MNLTYLSALPLLLALRVAGTPAEDPKPGPADLGKPAPAFELKSLDGKTVKLADFKDKLVVLEWFNPNCPYCEYAYGEGGPLRDYPEQLRSKGGVWLTVVSEKPDNPGGDPENIKRFVAENKMKAPVLLDPEGKVGKMYGAKTTPHMFVISEKGVLVYRGALDNAPRGKVEKGSTRANYVQAAIADLSSGHTVTTAETKPYG
jgi:peroxiredoxin